MADQSEAEAWPMLGGLPDSGRSGEPAFGTNAPVAYTPELPNKFGR